MAGEYHLTIERSKRRTISVQIEQDGSVLVKAPLRMSEHEISDFLAKHQSWIEKRVKAVKTRLAQKRQEGEYLYLGRTLSLTEVPFTEIKVEGYKLLFPLALTFRKEKEIIAWYQREARKIITSQVEQFAKEMDASYKEVTFSDTKSQWGRCTHDNRLQFSWRLVMAPLLVINYVVVHELAHTFQKNHTQLFWMKVRNYNPSYRQQIKWLKDHGQSLHES